MDVRCRICGSMRGVDDVEASKRILEVRCPSCETLHLVTAADEPPTLRGPDLLDACPRSLSAAVVAALPYAPSDVGRIRVARTAR